MHRDETAREDAAARALLANALERFVTALCDDLNISSAIAALNEGAAELGDNEGTVEDLRALEAMLHTLGILDLEWSSTATADDDLASQVESKIEERNRARAGKDFATADRIRTELREMGVEIMDSPSGTTWERVVQ